MQHFDETKIYRADDPALNVLASWSTRAHWRSEGRGPPFLRLGNRILYRGGDLNAWIASRVVRPGAVAA